MLIAPIVNLIISCLNIDVKPVHEYQSFERGYLRLCRLQLDSVCRGTSVNHGSPAQAAAVIIVRIIAMICADDHGDNNECPYERCDDVYQANKEIYAQRHGAVLFFLLIVEAYGDI